MEKLNEITMIFDSRPQNESLARIVAASFCTPLNPTLEDIYDIKAAVSEAVTNCIIHAYEDNTGKIQMNCFMNGNEVRIDIIDHGKGIEDVKKAMEPLYTTKPEMDRSGMGFTFMEAFMDEFSVESSVGNGTVVHMKRVIGR